MTDVRIKEVVTLEACTMDWLLGADGLDEREQLVSAARVALGTDAMAGANDVLPDPDSTDRRGWWGDMDADEIWGGWPVGTKNWLLSRAKITGAGASEGSTVERARQYTLAALQPFVDKQIASAISVSAIRADIDRIDVLAKIYRGPLTEIDLRFQLMWQEEPADDIPPPAFVESMEHKVRVPSGQLRLTGLVPSLLPPSGNLSLSSIAPQVANGKYIQPPAGQLAVSSTAPLPGVGKNPAAGQLTLSGTAPTVS